MTISRPDSYVFSDKTEGNRLPSLMAEPVREGSSTLEASSLGTRFTFDLDAIAKRREDQIERCTSETIRCIISALIVQTFILIGVFAICIRYR